MTILIDAILTDDDEEALRLINCNHPLAFFNQVDFLFKNNIRLIEGTDKLKQTALHHAARQDKYIIVERLIKNDVNLNARDIFGLTALHHAIIAGCARIVVLLLEAKADTEIYGSVHSPILTNSGLPTFNPPYTALQLAVVLKNETIIAHLLAYHANAHAPEGRKDMQHAKTALELAIIIGDVSIIKLLLKNNAHTNNKSLNRYNTHPKYIIPLYLAFHSQRLDLVDLLLANDANYLATYNDNQNDIFILSPEQIQYCETKKQKIIADREQQELEREKLDPRYKLTAIGQFIQKHDLFLVLKEIEPQIPSYFICPISFTLILDPVITREGETYDRKNIAKWFATGKNTDPNTNEILPDLTLTINKILKKQILDYLEELVAALQPEPACLATTNKIS